jgi:hypothetical protein
MAADSHLGGVWFADVHEYAKSPIHAPFLATLRSTLTAESPAGVRPEDCVMTGEGPKICIAIIPHKALDGVAMVANSTPEWVRLSWAQVTDLAYHDQLDMAVFVNRIPRSDPQWAVHLESALRSELRRPLDIQAETVGGEIVALRVSLQVDGKDRRIGRVVARRTGLFRRRDRGVAYTMTFAEPNPGPVEVPPPADHLRSQA